MAEPMTEQKTGAGKNGKRVWPRYALTGFLSFLALLLVIIGAGIVFLPDIVQSKARDFMAEQFDRKLTVGDISMNVFSLTMEMKDVSLSESGGNGTFASFDRLFVELSPETLTSFNPVIKQIRLTKPEVHIVRNQERVFNIADMVSYFSQTEEKKEDTGKTLFSINNIQIENGTIRADDEARDKHLLIDDLNISLPFIGNMPTDVDIFVNFGITARINKDKIELIGKSKPSRDRKGGRIGLKLERFDLPTYLGYLPFDPGFKLKSGKFSADLDIVFAKREEDKRPIYVEGSVTLDSVWLTEPDNTDVFRFSELKFDIARSDVVSRQIAIDRIGLKGSRVFVDRNAGGQWNFQRLLAGLPRKKTSQTDEAEKKKSAQAKRALTVDVRELAIDRGQVRLTDRVSGIQFDSGSITTNLGLHLDVVPDEKPRLFAGGNVMLNATGLSGLRNRATIFRLAGLKVDIGRSDVLSGHIGINHIGLKNPQVFLARDRNGQWNIGSLMKLGKGTASDSHVSSNAASGNVPLVIDLGALLIEGGQMRFSDYAYATPVQISADHFGLNVEKLTLDMNNRYLSADKVISSGTRVQMIHDLPELIARLQGKDKARVVKKAAHTASSHTGFRFRLKQAGVKGWAIHFENRHERQPVVTTVRQLDVMLENLTEAADKPVPLRFQAKVNDRGSIAVKGNVTASPLKAELDMDIGDVDIRFVQPYINDYVNLKLRQADLSVKGKLSAHQDKDGRLRGQFRGGLSIDRLAAVDQLTEQPFMSWKDLAFEGVTVDLDPLSIVVDRAKMSDMSARIILSSEGRLNLQDILRSKAGGQKSLTDSDAVRKNRARTAAMKRSGKRRKQNRKVAAAKPPFSIAIKRWQLRNGSVRFSDNFIKPRYTANIRNLRGGVRNISNDPATQSRIWMKGQVNGAPLVVSGYINPLSDSLSLNIKAQVTGMELAQFSAYTGKYLGYGIEKGKLSYKASYRISNGKLAAENSLILDQLTLGEKVKSDEATDLSIELALALLKDSDGVIDINVPIAGSLNDPEFSLGSIVGTVIMNALKKVVTAPFSFLASLNENEKELSGMTFAPGSAELTEKGVQRLERMARGLAKRPHIKLEITGRYDDVADRAGLGERVLNWKISALKRKKQSIPSFEEVSVSQAEYPALLHEVYRNESFDKPENVSDAEMEKLLAQYYARRDDNLILLANRRAEAVKNWLVLKGNLPDERIYLLASKKAEAEKDRPAHRVDFNLRWKN